MSLTGLTGNPRHDQLVALVSKHGYMNIDDLAQRLNVSTQTVRRDIRKLSEQGMVSRHHGGAGRPSSVVNTDFEQRESSYIAEKTAIAETIADYIPDRCTLFLTIGTTVEQVARALIGHKDLRVITNSLRVADILYKYDSFEVMVPGGSIRQHNGGIIGPAAISFIKGFRADYLITSIGTIEDDGTLLDYDVNESAVAKAMIKNSRHLLLVADHTKYCSSAAVEVGNISQATAIFSDQPAPPSIAAVMREHQVELKLSPSIGDE